MRKGRKGKGTKKRRPSGSKKAKGDAIANAKRVAAESQGGEASAKISIDNMDAVKSMGIDVGKDGKVDTAQARKVAEGAAASAAAAMGINIMKADGSIDTAKARQAVGAILGFSIEKDGASRQAEAAEVVRQSIIDSADAIGADIRNGDGDIDMEKARTVADAALGFATEQRVKLDRRGALDSLKSLEDLETVNTIAALDTSLKTFMTFSQKSRREAQETMSKLANASVIENGKISVKKAIEARDAAIAAAKSEANSQPVKPKISK